MVNIENFKYPALEEGTYLKDMEKRQKDFAKKAEKEEKKARRDRDMAIMGDIANLGAQVFANAGGAWMIDKTPSKAKGANDRIRELRDKNAALLSKYSKEYMDAAEAARIERNKQAMDKAKWDYNAEQDRLDNERKDKVADSQIAENNAREAYYKSTGSKGGSNGSGRKHTSYKIGDKTFSYEQNGDKYISAAYNELIHYNPAYKVTGGEYRKVLNPETGRYEETWVENPRYVPNEREMVDALDRHAIDVAEGNNNFIVWDDGNSQKDNVDKDFE